MLFSATAGQLADKFEKSRLIRWIKLFEIAIMAIGLAGFWRRDLTLLFTALALLGVHSTLFGPVKYAILPQQLKPEELIGGNGLVEMGTFVAILHRHDRRRARRRDRGERARCWPARSRWRSPSPAIWRAASIPPLPAVGPDLAHQLEPVLRNVEEPRASRTSNRVVWLSMLGISWFWFYGAIFLAQFAGLRARYRSAATSTSSRCCSRCSRSASASARCSASGCPDAASSSGSCRSARSG